MNDFTKDDLELLEDVLFLDIGNNQTDQLRVNNVHALKYKIQSMINNYCEHKDYKSMSEVDYIKTCCDCGEILDWD